MGVRQHERRMIFAVPPRLVGRQVPNHQMGNKDRAEHELPPTGWTWQEKIEDGWWSALAAEPVAIPASFGLMNGVWFKVKQGMQGLLVHDREEHPVVFMVCQPSTRYYQVMTRAKWMPALIDEVI